MIYEIRTYGIAPGSLAEVEKRYGEAYEYRKKYSALTAFWHTEIGPLNEIVVPFGFVPEVRPGKVGPIFELRYYTLKPGTLPDVAAGWEAKLPERTKLSPVVLAGGVEFGRANGFVHIWAYSSLDQRARVRDDARQKGVWRTECGSDKRPVRFASSCWVAPRDRRHPGGRQHRRVPRPAHRASREQRAPFARPLAR